jgi:hypothetical protein
MGAYGGSWFNQMKKHLTSSPGAKNQKTKMRTPKLNKNLHPLTQAENKEASPQHDRRIYLEGGKSSELKQNIQAH